MQVGIDHDMAQFAVNSIRGGWEHLGRERYTDARTLTVTADCGGANGYRTRLWKVELQRLADETGLSLPAGHQQVEQDRASAVLLHHHQLARQTAHRACDDRQPDRLHPPPAAISWSLLDSTRAATPPRSRSRDAELEAVNLHGHAFHPDWHDTREPRILTRRRLTLHVEGAATAKAYDAVGLFVRHGSREVDGTPRSDVLD